MRTTEAQCTYQCEDILECVMIERTRWVRRFLLCLHRHVSQAMHMHASTSPSPHYCGFPRHTALTCPVQTRRYMINLNSSPFIKQSTDRGCYGAEVSIRVSHPLYIMEMMRITRDTSSNLVGSISFLFLNNPETFDEYQSSPLHEMPI